MPHIGGAALAADQSARCPVGESSQRLEPVRRSVGQALSEVATEKETADARNEQPGGETWDGVVRPREETDSLRCEKPPAPEQASDEAPIRHEAAVSKREEIPDRLEFVRIGHDVEDAGPGQ